MKLFRLIKIRLNEKYSGVPIVKNQISDAEFNRTRRNAHSFIPFVVMKQ
jgi:hypothetical protein